jgi:uncharacterized protein (DUF1499 family)
MSLTLVALAGGFLGFLLVAASGFAYRSGAPLLAALGAFAVGAFIGMVGVIAALSALALSMKRGQPLSTVVIAALVAGLIAFALPLRQIWAAWGLPAIHDISTDLENPPTFEAVLPLRRDAPNGVEFSQETAADQRRAYPDIRTLVVSAPADAVFAQALDAAREMSWEIVTADRASGRIEATAETRWFGFKDDVVVRLSPDATGGVRVDARSVSRVGRGDLGTNAARIREYFQRLSDQ